MSLRIAFDLDGVLADLASAYTAIGERLLAQKKMADRSAGRPSEGGPSSSEATTKAAESNNGEEIVEEGVAVSRLSRRQQNVIWREIRSTPDFWTTLEPLERGVVRRIQELSIRHRWETFFVTHRPGTAGDTVQRQTQRWLVKQGVELPTVLVLHGSRGKVCDALHLDFLVDDTLQHCVDVISESKTRPILVLHADDAVTRRRATRLAIEVVSSVAEGLDYLDRFQQAAGKHSLIYRLAKRVGLT